MYAVWGWPNYDCLLKSLGFHNYLLYPPKRGSWILWFYPSHLGDHNPEFYVEV